MDDLELLIIRNLSDDLLRSKYRGNNNNLYGHCYVATEAYYHLMDEDQKDYNPAYIKIKDITHWFLKNGKTDEIIDITARQFNFTIDYSNAKFCDFLSKEPSKRAKILINRVYEEIGN